MSAWRRWWRPFRKWRKHLQMPAIFRSKTSKHWTISSTRTCVLTRDATLSSYQKDRLPLSWAIPGSKPSSVSSRTRDLSTASDISTWQIPVHMPRVPWKICQNVPKVYSFCWKNLPSQIATVYNCLLFFNILLLYIGMQFGEYNKIYRKHFKRGNIEVQQKWKLSWPFNISLHSSGSCAIIPGTGWIHVTMAYYFFGIQWVITL